MAPALRSPAPVRIPRREANERAWRQYQAKDRAIFHEKQARTYAGTYDGYVASNRAKQARDDAKR